MAAKQSSKPTTSPERKAAAPPPPEEESGDGFLVILREWLDALVIAFVLAMFIRVFVVELFKIPTGSMTPTLLGDFVYERDLDEDGVKDLIVKGNKELVFMKKDDHYEPDEIMLEKLQRSGQIRKWLGAGEFKAQYDRILVNKFEYWFHNPRQGDVVVFKVPEVIWDPMKPIYIKRCVGAPGDKISFDGRLKLDGKDVEKPRFFQHQEYINRVPYSYASRLPNFVTWDDKGGGEPRITGVTVPPDGIYVMGDNTHSSLDSRYWGTVPLPNLKGKAFIRYWPLNKLSRIQ